MYNLNNRPVVVTGGAGFIGSAVIWGLNAAGHDNIIVVDNLGNSEKWRNLVNTSHARYIHRDAFLSGAPDIFKELKPAAVIHLGACSSTTETDADFLLANNTHYSQTLCRLALEGGARFINASSAATYGNGQNGFSDDPAGLESLRPLNMYGYSKHLFDLWLKRNALLGSVASLKFFNVYGPNEYHKGDMASVVLKARRQIAETGRMRLFKSSSPEYGDGCQMRDFVYVKDCVRIILRLLEETNVNGIFNVGTGMARTWNDLAKAVFAAMRQPEKIEYIDMPENLRGKYQNFTQADMNWLTRLWPDFKFASLEAGVRDYIRGYLMEVDPYLGNKQAGEFQE